MDKVQTTPQEIQSSINFSVKMMNFFQQLRDDCHDFISTNFKQKRDLSESSGLQDMNNYQCKKVSKIQKYFHEQGNSKNKELNELSEFKAKKPISPFLLFYSENYHRIAQKYTGNPFKEMMKHVSQEWKDMTKEQQEPYIKRHEQSKQLYQIDIKQNQKQIKQQNPIIKTLLQSNNENDLKSIVFEQIQDQGSLDSHSEVSMNMAEEKSSD